MVGGGRLLQAERRLEVADADLALAGPHEAVEDLDAVPVGESLEGALEIGRLRIG